MDFPMRINKYLAQKGYSTRRGADELIESRKVYINGVRAVLGSKVLENDTVEVRPSKKPKKHIYLAYHKPKGIVAHSPQGEEKDIAEAIVNIPGTKDVFPVGRLDKDSHGLIILTNDGRITDRLLNPEHEHEKEYFVTTTQKLRDSFTKHMSAGVDIGDYITKPCTLTRVGDSSFRIVLSEGKRHQIRRMVDAMHNGVSELTRTRIMNIKLGRLAPGTVRKIDGEELTTFLSALGL